MRGDEVARALLGVLVTLEGVRVIPLDETAVAKVSTAVPLAGGDLSRAHTLQVALANRAYYVTTDPQTVPSILDKEQVHAVPTYDAPN